MDSYSLDTEISAIVAAWDRVRFAERKLEDLRSANITQTGDWLAHDSEAMIQQAVVIPPLREWMLSEVGNLLNSLTDDDIAALRNRQTAESIW